MSDDLKRMLRSLCSQYGYTEVYGTLMDHMRHTYVELDTFFRPSGEVKNLVLSPETTAPASVPKKEVKKVEPPKVPEEVKKVVVKAADVLNQVTQPKPEEVVKRTQHKMAIDKRLAELRAMGQTAPFPLLTEENMKQWIEKDGLTYWKIAEITGAPDTQVSAVAKMYKLQSNASKMIFFGKQKQK